MNPTPQEKLFEACCAHLRAMASVYYGDVLERSSLIVITFPSGYKVSLRDEGYRGSICLALLTSVGVVIQNAVPHTRKRFEESLLPMIRCAVLADSLPNAPPMGQHVLTPIGKRYDFVFRSKETVEWRRGAELLEVDDCPEESVLRNALVHRVSTHPGDGQGVSRWVISDPDDPKLQGALAVIFVGPSRAYFRPGSQA